MAPITEKPRVLFVDDDERLVEGLARNFRQDYDVHVATSARDALKKLAELRNVAVVVTDFRMPQMDGATFLQEAMYRAPATTRILLTGEPGIEGAKDAVNRGHIFGFLTKPCPPDQLKQSLDAGIEHYRLINAERHVLQEALIESVAALMEVLAVTNPPAFARAQRITGLVRKLAQRLESGGFWQIDAAAQLSQIGYFAMNPALAEKIFAGRELGTEEQAQAAAVPGLARRLLERMPRLEPVMQILTATEWTDAQLARAGESMIGLGARILRAALEYDLLNRQGVAPGEIPETLRIHEVRFGARVLDALADVVGRPESEQPELELPLRRAKPGMRLRQELRTAQGALLVPMGTEISARLLERIAQIAPDLLDRPVLLAPPTAG